MPFGSDWDLPAYTTATKLALVCDPRYQPQQHGWQFPAIRVSLPEDLLGGDIYTYDLGWGVNKADLPPGNVRFELVGTAITDLAGNLPVEDADRVEVTIFCYQLGDNGQLLHSPSDRAWRLTIVTDLASRYLQVQHSKLCSMPIYCNRCRAVLDDSARVCQVCSSFRLCWLCSMRSNIGHPPDHNFGAITNPPSAGAARGSLVPSLNPTIGRRQRTPSPDSDYAPSSPLSTLPSSRSGSPEDPWSGSGSLNNNRRGGKDAAAVRVGGRGGGHGTGRGRGTRARTRPRPVSLHSMSRRSSSRSSRPSTIFLSDQSATPE